jgi:hypothetical protein
MAAAKKQSGGGVKAARMDGSYVCHFQKGQTSGRTLKP